MRLLYFFFADFNFFLVSDLSSIDLKVAFLTEGQNYVKELFGTEKDVNLKSIRDTNKFNEDTDIKSRTGKG